MEITGSYTEICNGRTFTHEQRRYGPQQYRTIYRIDGRIVARTDFIRHRRTQRRLEQKAATRSLDYVASDKSWSW